MRKTPRCALRRLELLESREVPAVTIVNASTATFTDVDGDVATVKVSAGTLTGGSFVWTPTGLGDQLNRINLTGGGFAGANVTVTARRGPTGGDGFVNVGAINAFGVDLGAVFVRGDLGQIDAGDFSGATTGLKSLTVQSLGRFGLLTQGGFGDLASSITGPLGALTVKSDVVGARVEVLPASPDPTSGRIGNVTIGGSLVGGTAPISGRIVATGTLGKVNIGGDIRGGDGDDSGRINASGSIASVTVGGSIIGGLGNDSGQVSTFGSIVRGVKIGADVRGGAGDRSGRIAANGALGNVTVGQSVTGAGGQDSGTITGGAVAKVVIARNLAGGTGPGSARVASAAEMGNVNIGGSVIGTSDSAGQITAVTLANVTIGGSLRGGLGSYSGMLSAASMGRVVIGQDVIGNDGFHSGSIFPGARLGGLSVGGSLIGGTGDTSGAVQSNDITSLCGHLSVGGDLIGNTALFSGAIALKGDEDIQVGDVNIGGSLRGGFSGLFNASLFVFGSSGAARIGGDVYGADLHLGTLPSLTIGGSVQFFVSVFDVGTARIGGDVIGGLSFGRVDRLTIDGSVFAGSTTEPSIEISYGVDHVVIKGSVIGTSPAIPAIVEVGTAENDVAFRSLTVGGRVENALIRAGQSSNADAQIGAVTVGGDWIASSIAAGVDPGDGDPFLGDSNDAKLFGPNVKDVVGVFSRIDSITIKGQVLGTNAAGDHFGFVAQQIGSLKIGSFSLSPSAGITNFPLTPGAANDFAGLLIGVTGDVMVREVGL